MQRCGCTRPLKGRAIPTSPNMDTSTSAQLNACASMQMSSRRCSGTAFALANDLEAINGVSEEDKENAMEYLNTLKDQAEQSKLVGDNHDAVLFLESISGDIENLQKKLANPKQYKKNLAKAKAL